jgi:hypothetical protein
LVFYDETTDKKLSYHRDPLLHQALAERPVIAGNDTSGELLVSRPALPAYSDVLRTYLLKRVFSSTKSHGMRRAASTRMIYGKVGETYYVGFKYRT